MASVDPNGALPIDTSRSRGHRIRFDRHGGDFRFATRKKGTIFSFSNGQNIEKDAERRYFETAPRKIRRGATRSTNRRESNAPSRISAARVARSGNRGLIGKSKPRRRRVRRGIRRKREHRRRAGGEHRAPSRFAKPRASAAGVRERDARRATKSTFPNRTSILVGVGYYRLATLEDRRCHRVGRRIVFDHSSSRTNPAPPSSNPGRRIAARGRARVRSRYRKGPKSGDHDPPAVGAAAASASPSRRIAARHTGIPSLASSASRYDAYPPRPTSAGSICVPPPRPAPCRGESMVAARVASRSPVRGVRSPAASATRRRDVPRSDARVVIPGGHARDEEEILRAAASSDKTRSPARRRATFPGRQRTRCILRRIRPSRSRRAVRAGEPQGEKYAVQVRAADGVVTGRGEGWWTNRGATRGNCRTRKHRAAPASAAEQRGGIAVTVEDVADVRANARRGSTGVGFEVERHAHAPGELGVRVGGGGAARASPRRRRRARARVGVDPGNRRCRRRPGDPTN